MIYELLLWSALEIPLAAATIALIWLGNHIWNTEQDERAWAFLFWFIAWATAMLTLAGIPVLVSIVNG